MDDEEHGQDIPAPAEGGEEAAAGPRPYGRRRRGRRGGKGGAADAPAAAAAHSGNGGGFPSAPNGNGAGGDDAARRRRRRRGPRPVTAGGASTGYSSAEPEAVKPVRELLETILEKLGVPRPEVAYIPRSEGEYLEVRGPDLANLIGRHGHTLEALNLVFNNIVNAGVRNNRRYYTIDAEGYRARRADQLKGLALETLERAVRERKPIMLEPMLPSERKVIHLALADSPFVTTESTGVEPDRRVVVTPK